MGVLSPPLRPSGAVEVTKVTPTGATVMWKKPKDDGGSPITGYIVEKKDVEKDYWSPCGKVTGKMANVMRELECDVTDLVENFVYVFRVYATNAIGDGTPLSSLTTSTSSTLTRSGPSLTGPRHQALVPQTLSLRSARLSSSPRTRRRRRARGKARRMMRRHQDQFLK